MRRSHQLTIDFGTSTTIAVLTRADGQVWPLLFDSSPLLPSAVCIDQQGILRVGRDALHLAQASPEGFEPNPKRRIDEPLLLLGGEEVPIGDLIGAVLRRVAGEARRVTGEALGAVTLTHPAAWGATRRQILIDAAAKAAMTAHLVPEPVAAATYFITTVSAAMPVGSCVVVYDLGAGTFDASVVRRGPHGLEVLASAGLADVGGLDIDAAIFTYLTETYSAPHPASWQRLTQPQTPADRRARRLLWEDIRQAKEILSRSSATQIHLPLVDQDAPLGREQLEQLAAPVLAQTVAATRSAISSARVPANAVTGVFLVGGSSRIPLVSTLLHRDLGLAPTVLEQPELVVAQGAALIRAGSPTVAAPATPPLVTPPGPIPAPARAAPVVQPTQRYPATPAPTVVARPAPTVVAPPAPAVTAPPAPVRPASPTRPVGGAQPGRSLRAAEPPMPTPPSSNPATTSNPATSGNPGTPAGSLRSRIGSVLVLAALVVVGILVWRSGEDEPTTPGSTSSSSASPSPEPQTSGTGPTAPPLGPAGADPAVPAGAAPGGRTGAAVVTYPATAVGTWTGTLVQDNGKQFAMEVRITEGAAQGSVSYPQLGCTGTWNVIVSNSQGLQIRELITIGGQTCTAQGTVTAVPSSGNRLQVSYQPDGASYVGNAVLERS